MEKVTTSFVTSKILMYKVKEKVNSLEISMSDYINSLLLSDLGGKIQEVVEKEGLDETLIFFFFSKGQLIKIAFEVSNTAYLVQVLRRRLQGSKKIKNVDIFGDEVRFEIISGTISLPNKKLNNLEEIEDELMAIHKIWMNKIKEGEKEIEEEKIKSLMEII
ncbi:MAG: hypothetical protein KAU20_05610 [Nanoarchaeota archaeon]|nr:hypothetical protein [Nanoarchaeota archaeon]